MTEAESWFLEQVERSHVRLRAYIRAKGVRAEEVDDLAQEVFLLCWEKLGGFDRAGDFEAWARQIVRRLIANEWRKGSRRNRLLSDRMTLLLLDADGPAAGESQTGNGSEQELHVLRECVSKLPEASRQLLHHRYFDELSPGAIGSLLGKSSNQIRQSLMRVRRALLECMRSRLQMTTM